MTKDELYEALSLIDHVYRQGDTNIPEYGYFNEKKSRSMLKVANVLTVSGDLKGTPAEAFLNKAHQYARANDESKIDVVCELLRETKKYIEEQGHSKSWKK